MSAAGMKLLYGAWGYEVSREQLATNLPLFNMLNLRYILAPATISLSQISDMKKIASLDLDVYESQGVWPRAFFTDRVFAYQGEEQLIQALRTRAKTPFAAVAKEELKAEPLLNKFLSSVTSSTPRQTVAATDYVLTNNRTSFNVKAPGPGVVVLTEAYMSHDFQLKVNGRPEHYFRVNSAFKGFFAPRAGEYTICFLYRPRYFTLLLCMSGVGIAVLIFWLAVLSRSSFASSTSHV